MSSQIYADRLAAALTRTGFVEVVQPSFVEGRVTVLFRVKAGVDHKWMEVVTEVLIATEKYANTANGWAAHICKTFFLKEVKKEKRLVFGWTMAITSQNLPAALDMVIRIVGGETVSPPVVAEQVEEVPLVGASRERNAPGEGGKGAYGIGGRSDFRPPIRR